MNQTVNMTEGKVSSLILKFFYCRFFVGIGKQILYFAGAALRCGKL